MSQAPEIFKADLQPRQFACAGRRNKRVLRHEPRQTVALPYLGVLKHLDGNHELGSSLVRVVFKRQLDDDDIRKTVRNILTALNRGAEAEPLCRGPVTERPDNPAAIPSTAFRSAS